MLGPVTHAQECNIIISIIVMSICMLRLSGIARATLRQAGGRRDVALATMAYLATGHYELMGWCALSALTQRTNA